jgi:hypothetical protein
VVAAVTRLVERARVVGAIRPDPAPQEIAAIFAMLGPVFDLSRATSLDLWRRYLTLLLDGLRPSLAAAVLPVPPPPVELLDAVLKAGKRSETDRPRP